VNNREEAPELNRRAVREAWERIGAKEAFFVPCIDTKAGKKITLELGYVQGKPPPEVHIGILRGQWGLLCYRTTREVSVRTAKRDWF
jgi:hypothetical protein